MEEIDLRELVNTFWEKKVIIAIAILVFAIIGAIYTYAIKTPMYSSSASLVLAQAQAVDSNSNISEITTTDVTLNSKLVTTYSEIIKSSSVLREVISNLGIQIDEATLRKNIDISSVEDTEVIKITVTDENPEKASKIANETANVFIEKAKEIYKIDNVQILDNAEPAKAPSNINNLKTIIIFVLIGIVLSCGYILILNMFDTTVKSSDEIEKKLNIPVLAAIPTNTRKQGKGGRN